MIRPLNPLDMAALVSFAGSAPNEAAPRERLAVSGAETDWTGALFRQWLVLGGKRRTLGYLAGRRLVGLVSVRERSGPSVWEVDGLCVAPVDEQVCADLLEAAAGSVSSVKAERLFLRLHSDSPLLAAARSAGFGQYLCESLYQITPALLSAASSATPHIRRRLPRDEHALFRLCCASMPENVRCAQGLTLELWRGSRERGLCRDYVYEEDGELLGWLKASVRRNEGCFDICVSPAAHGQVLRRLVEHAARLLRHKPRVFCLVAGHQIDLFNLMRETGCSEAAVYAALVRHLALRETEPSLLPSRA